MCIEPLCSQSIVGLQYFAQTLNSASSMTSSCYTVNDTCESHEVQFLSIDAAISRSSTDASIVVGVAFWHRSIKAVRQISVLPFDLKRFVFVVDLDNTSVDKFERLFPGVGFGNMPAQPIISVWKHGQLIFCMFSEWKCFALLGSESRIRDLCSSLLSSTEIGEQ